MATVIKTTFKLRRGFAKEWAEKNPILEAGEPGFVTDTFSLKIGDGKTPWNSLPYVSSSEIGGSAIVNVGELPTQDIHENCFYRLLSSKAVLNGQILDIYTTYCVNELPEIGAPAANTDGTEGGSAYYNIQDKIVYGYIDSILSTATEIPEGWHPMSEIAADLFGGVITDIIDDPCDDKLRVLLTYGNFYIYQDGWCEMPLAYEKKNNGIDIQFDGVIDDKITIVKTDIPKLKECFIKVSDNTFTADEVIGSVVTIFENGRYDVYQEVSSNHIDTSFPGVISIAPVSVLGDVHCSTMIMSISSPDKVIAALGLPDGSITRGTYFYYGVHQLESWPAPRISYVSSWTNKASSVIKKIDEKFLPTMGSGIIDVTELPTENINQNAFYRLAVTKAKIILNGNDFTGKGYICNCVNDLPETGLPVTNADMSTLYAYYNTQDGMVYGYIEKTLSAALSVPVGWYDIGLLMSTVGQPWGGIITDIKDDPHDDTPRVLITFTNDYYTYQDKWIKHIFASETLPEYNVQWDGNMAGRLALDMSILGYNQGEYFVKVSDDVFTPDELMGCAITIYASTQEQFIITENVIDTT